MPKKRGKKHKVPKKPNISKKKPKIAIKASTPKVPGEKILAEYSFPVNNVPIQIKIYTRTDQFVPNYDIEVSSISPHTQVIFATFTLFTRLITSLFKF